MTCTTQLKTTQCRPPPPIIKGPTVVNLVVSFTAGQFYMRSLKTGNMQAGFNMKGWSYSIALNLDFAGIDRDAVKNGVAAPVNVRQQLEQSTSNQF
jgi:hypothetical protein